MARRFGDVAPVQLERLIHIDTLAERSAPGEIRDPLAPASHLQNPMALSDSSMKASTTQTGFSCQQNASQQPTKRSPPGDSRTAATHSALHHRCRKIG